MGLAHSFFLDSHNMRSLQTLYSLAILRVSESFVKFPFFPELPVHNQTSTSHLYTITLLVSWLHLNSRLIVICRLAHAKPSKIARSDLCALGEDSMIAYTLAPRPCTQRFFWWRSSTSRPYSSSDVVLPRKTFLYLVTKL